MEKVGPPSSATDGVTRAGPGQNAEDGAEVTCHRPDERLKAGMESADGIGARAAFIAFPLAVCANMLPTPIGAVLSAFADSSNKQDSKETEDPDCNTWGKSQGLKGLKGMFPPPKKRVVAKCSPSGKPDAGHTAAAAPADVITVPASTGTAPAVEAADQGSPPAAEPDGQATAVATASQQDTAEPGDTATAATAATEADKAEGTATTPGGPVGNTPLHDALLKDPDKALDPDLLAEHTTTINSRDTAMGWTPLHYAAAAHNAAAVDQLLDAGASPSAVATSSGITPLHLAVISKPDLSTAVTRTAFAADTTSIYSMQTRLCGRKSPEGLSPGSLEVVQLLLAAGADASAAAVPSATAGGTAKQNGGVVGATPLHFAACVVVKNNHKAGKTAGTTPSGDATVACAVPCGGDVADASDAHVTVGQAVNGDDDAMSSSSQDQPAADPATSTEQTAVSVTLAADDKGEETVSQRAAYAASAAAGASEEPTKPIVCSDGKQAAGATVEGPGAIRPAAGEPAAAQQTAIVAPVESAAGTLPAIAQQAELGSVEQNAGVQHTAEHSQQQQLASAAASVAAAAAAGTSRSSSATSIDASGPAAAGQSVEALEGSLHADSNAALQQEQQAAAAQQSSSNSSSTRLSAAEQHVEIIYALMEAGADPNAAVHDANAETPLTLAAFNGAAVSVAALIMPPKGCKGADPDKPRGNDLCRPIDLAVYQAHAHLALLLLEHGALAVPDSRCIPPAGTTVVLGGMKDFDSNMLRAGTATAGSVQEKPEERVPQQLLTAALWNCKDCPTELIQRIIDEGFSLDVVHESSGATAVGIAVRNSNLEVLKLLISAGADVNIPWTKGWSVGFTPVLDAARLGDLEVLDTLIGAGADIHNCIDPRPKMYNYSIVQTAANNGHLEAVVKLVEAGASWRVARGVSQCHTVPQILVAKNKGTQASHVEWRLKLAEKKARQHKAAADAGAGPVAAAASADDQQQASPNSAPTAATADVDAILAELGLEDPTKPTLSRKAQKALARREQQQQHELATHKTGKPTSVQQQPSADDAPSEAANDGGQQQQQHAEAAQSEVHDDHDVPASPAASSSTGSGSDNSSFTEPGVWQQSVGRRHKQQQVDPMRQRAKQLQHTRSNQQHQHVKLQGPAAVRVVPRPAATAAAHGANGTDQQRQQQQGLLGDQPEGDCKKRQTRGGNRVQRHKLAQRHHQQQQEGATHRQQQQEAAQPDDDDDLKGSSWPSLASEQQQQSETEVAADDDDKSPAPAAAAAFNSAAAVPASAAAAGTAAKSWKDMLRGSFAPPPSPAAAPAAAVSAASPAAVTPPVTPKLAIARMPDTTTATAAAGVDSSSIASQSPALLHLQQRTAPGAAGTGDGNSSPSAANQTHSLGPAALQPAAAPSGILTHPAAPGHTAAPVEAASASAHAGWEFDGLPQAMKEMLIRSSAAGRSQAAVAPAAAAAVDPAVYTALHAAALAPPSALAVDAHLYPTAATASKLQGLIASLDPAAVGGAAGVASSSNELRSTRSSISSAGILSSSDMQVHLHPHEAGGQPVWQISRPSTAGSGSTATSAAEQQQLQLPTIVQPAPVQAPLPVPASQSLGMTAAAAAAAVARRLPPHLAVVRPHANNQQAAAWQAPDVHQYGLPQPESNVPAAAAAASRTSVSSTAPGAPCATAAVVYPAAEASQQAAEAPTAELTAFAGAGSVLQHWKGSLPPSLMFACGRQPAGTTPTPAMGSTDAAAADCQGLGTASSWLHHSTTSSCDISSHYITATAPHTNVMGLPQSAAAAGTSSTVLNSAPATAAAKPPSPGTPSAAISVPGVLQALLQQHDACSRAMQSKPQQPATPSPEAAATGMQEASRATLVVSPTQHKPSIATAEASNSGQWSAFDTDVFDKHSTETAGAGAGASKDGPGLTVARLKQDSGGRGPMKRPTPQQQQQQQVTFTSAEKWIEDSLGHDDLAAADHSSTWHEQAQPYQQQDQSWGQHVPAKSKPKQPYQEYRKLHGAAAVKVVLRPCLPLTAPGAVKPTSCGGSSNNGHQQRQGHVQRAKHHQQQQAGKRWQQPRQQHTDVAQLKAVELLQHAAKALMPGNDENRHAAAEDYW